MADTALAAPPRRAGPGPVRRLAGAIARAMPKGLYARSLIIIITPVVLLQSVIAYVFMERTGSS
jgi:two-component system osmolarity sensor histidine kinase EnvZ